MLMRCLILVPLNEAYSNNNTVSKNVCCLAAFMCLLLSLLRKLGSNSLRPSNLCQVIGT